MSSLRNENEGVRSRGRSSYRNHEETWFVATVLQERETPCVESITFKLCVISSPRLSQTDSEVSQELESARLRGCKTFQVPLRRLSVDSVRLLFALACFFWINISHACPQEVLDRSRGNVSSCNCIFTRYEGAVLSGSVFPIPRSTIALRI